ncbi:MAG: DUF2723 domain-containing protein [Patescibacteria group bacterium]
MKKQINLYLSLLIGALIIVSSLFFLSTYLYNWDTGQFALGLEHFDVKMHQPHPPGYPIFIFLGKILDYIFNNANLSLSILSLLFATLAGVFFYYLVITVSKNQKLAFMSSLFFIFNPVFWFYREVALTYTVDLLASILIALAGFKILFTRQYKYFYLIALVFGLVGGIRPSLLPLLFPLMILILFFVRSKKVVFWSLTLFVICFLSWFVPMVYISGGLKEYYDTTLNLFLAAAESTSIFSQIKTFGGILFVAICGILIPLLLSVFYYFNAKNIWKKFKAINNNFSLIKFTLIILAWILPASFVYSFLHFGQPGYVLVILPAFYLLSILGMSYFLQGKIKFAILLILLIGQALIFLIPGYSTAIDFRLSRIDPWLTKFSANKIIENDKKLETIFTSINNYINSRGLNDKEVIMIVPRNLFYMENGIEMRNDEIFRQIMYYYPNIEILELAPNRDYYLKGENYKTETVKKNKYSLSENKKAAIFVANNIEEQDMPTNLKLQKSNRIYFADLEKINNFTFLENKFQFKKTKDCDCGN